jgi:hypothetical protein
MWRIISFCMWRVVIFCITWSKTFGLLQFMHGYGAYGISLGILRVQYGRMESRKSLTLYMQWVVDFVCMESHWLFHNLTNMCWKPLACFGLCVGMVPKAYYCVKGWFPVFVMVFHSQIVALAFLGMIWLCQLQNPSQLTIPWGLWEVNKCQEWPEVNFELTGQWECLQ